jgi:serine/threonine protein kinase/Flp pilus assembly protein TadD
MTASGSAPDPLGQLAEEFLERHRRGERPAVTEYAARHPDLAEQIRELFPALVMMEGVRPDPPTVIGAAGSGGGAASPPRLGEYRLVREIGRGGMGVVYEAEQESLGRRVALKVLPPGALGDAHHVERFQREARAAARLHHTNIVPVFGVGEEDGTHYYVMQYIEGHPLDKVLAELRRLRDEAGPRARPPVETPPAAPESPPTDRGLSGDVARCLEQGHFCAAGRQDGARGADPDAGPPAKPGGSTEPPAAPSSSLLPDPRRPYARRVAQLGVQVAEALEYAAGQGVLHRDVKPSNLLLDVWGTIWLTDFGLAKATGTPDLTRTGDLLGTLRYMAPERFGGRADVRSDVYALGLTLYEMLALRPAFGGHDQAEVTRHITMGEAPRLDRLNPQLPRDLVTVVHKAMAKEPADRYQTAGALAEDLRRFLDDRSIVARRLSLPEQTWRLCRRNPSTAALVAALLALVVLAAGGGLWLERQQVERRAERARRRDLARQAVEAALQQADPRRSRDRWREAKAVLASVESRLDEANCQDLRERLEQACADLELALRLEEIRVQRATYVDDAFAADTAVRDYAAAFAAAGLAPADPATPERIRGSAIREQLVAALDDWALATSNSLVRWQLTLLASSVDPDPKWRDRMPGPLVWDERAALEKLAAEVPVAEQSPQFLNVLEVRLRRAGADAERFLRKAQRLHPSDFWLNLDLGLVLMRKDKPAAAAGFFLAALAVRPDCSYVHGKLGRALSKLGETEDAAAAFRRAVELDRKNATAHYDLADALLDRGQTEQAIAEYRRAIECNPAAATIPHNKLGLALRARGQVGEAMAEYRRAIACDPKAPAPHYNLAVLLENQGQVGEAMAEYRRVAACDPRDPVPHIELGMGLQDRDQLDEAMVEYRRALELDPRNARAHYQVGTLLRARGRWEEAVAQFRKAVQLDPRGALGHDSLADGLLRLGRFAEARAAAQHALDLFPASEPRRPSLRKTLELCDRMLALDGRLPALLQGSERPGAAELLDLARLCRDYGRPYAAARLYAAAFAARPGLADDLGSHNRYDAACTAARAAAGPGADQARLGERERAGLRRQALDWLRADLALRTRPRQGGKPAGQAPTTWQTDTALAGVRDQAALEKLPDDERREWQRLWADVAAARPDDTLAQARAQAARQEWRQAADCYARAFERDPTTEEGHHWFEYAAVLLLSGDRPGYARACAHMVERCDPTTLDLRPYHVARACTLAPDSVADPAAPGRLAQKDLAGQAREFWSLTEQGALHYRAGRFKQAVPLLKQSLKADPQPGRAVLNWLWLALAEQRLGNSEEARRWLGKAQELLDQYGDGMPGRAEEDLGLHLHNWLEAHVLRREAEALLGAGPAQPRESAPAAVPDR